MEILRNKNGKGVLWLDYEVYLQLPEKRYILKAWLLMQVVELWELI